MKSFIQWILRARYAATSLLVHGIPVMVRGTVVIYRATEDRSVPTAQIGQFRSADRSRGVAGRAASWGGGFGSDEKAIGDFEGAFCDLNQDPSDMVFAQ